MFFVGKKTNSHKLATPKNLTWSEKEILAHKNWSTPSLPSKEHNGPSWKLLLWKASVKSVVNVKPWDLYFQTEVILHDSKRTCLNLNWLKMRQAWRRWFYIRFARQQENGNRASNSLQAIEYGVDGGVEGDGSYASRVDRGIVLQRAEWRNHVDSHWNGNPTNAVITLTVITSRAHFLKYLNLVRCVMEELTMGQNLNLRPCKSNRDSAQAQLIL